MSKHFRGLLMVVVTALSFLMLSACYEELQPGQMPASVEFNVTETHVVWRYVGTEEWANLLELDLIRGAAGEPGENGKNVQFDVTETHIVWQYEGDETWTDLILLSSFKGEDGLQGPAGDNGKDGISVVGSYINEAGILFLELSDETEIEVGLVRGNDGSDGKEVEFNVTETHIVWRYVGDTDWVDLVSLSTLKGVDGTNGSNGKEVLFDVTETHIVWQYEGDETWTDLILLSSFKGEDGLQGPAGNNGKDGISVVGSYINEAGILFLELSDETEIEVGLVRGNDGSDGKDGNDGLSAYEIYLKYNPNYNKSEAQWLTDLVKGRLSDSETTDVLTEAQLLEAISDLTVEKIQLQQPITLTNDLVINREMTINFNDYNVKGNLSIVMETTEIVTLQNGTLDGRITVNQIESVELDNLVITGNVIDISAQLELLEQTVLDAMDYTYLDYTYLHSQMSYENRVLMSLYLESVLVEYNEELLKGVMDDMARFLGALYRVEGNIHTIFYNETSYHWNSQGTLKGSNWINEDNQTLVSMITMAFLLNPTMNQVDFTLLDENGYGIPIKLSFELEMDQTEALEAIQQTFDDALAYEYANYTYNYNTRERLQNDITSFYFESELLDYNADLFKGIMDDMARFLGALYRVEGSANHISYDGVTYTWDSEGTLAGSNWKDEQGVTLVSVITQDFLLGKVIDNTIVMSLFDENNYGIDFALVFDLEMDKTEALEAIQQTFDDALAYEYLNYTYNYNTRERLQNDITSFYFESELLDYNADLFKGIMDDMARFLGALYRVEGSANHISYEGVTYTWDSEGTLAGSNWKDEQGVTLVSVITQDFLLGKVVDNTIVMSLFDENNYGIDFALVFDLEMDKTEALENAVLETTTTGDLMTGLSFNYPEVISSYFDTYAYKMNTYITVSEDILGEITITMSGDMSRTEVLQGLPKGTYTFLELFNVSNIIFDQQHYGGRIETYKITITGNIEPINAKITMNNVISNDAFETSLTLALVSNDITFEADEVAAMQALDDTFDDALAYVYSDYTYHYETQVVTNKHIHSVYSNWALYQLNNDDNHQGILFDMARFLGALRYVDGRVEGILYDGIMYTWNTLGTLKGSNWENEQGQTLVSTITNDFMLGTLNQGVIISIVDSNEFERQVTLTFEITIDTVTIDFVTNGGSEVEDVLLLKDTKLTEPVTTKVNHAFIGWYVDELLQTKYDFEDLVTSDLTLYARFIALEEITESFDNYTQSSYGNGSFVGTNDITWTYEVATGGSNGFFQFRDAGFLSATFNARIESISITASAFGDGRSFDITVNDELYTFSDIGTTEVTYTIDQLMIDGQLTILINNPSASTKIHSISFTSSYPENGFSPELSDIADAIIVEESTFEPLKDVTAEDIEDYDLTNQIEVTVTDSNKQIVTNYGDFSQMAPGVYTITYRVMDSDLNETVKSITLTIEEYQVFSVTFYEDGGTNIDDLIDVEVGTTIIEPKISKDGFVFEGWYRDQALTTLYDFDTLMTADLNLYAKWAAITSINEIKSMADGEIINYVKGVVTGISLSNGNLYISDAAGTIVVRDSNYYSVAVIGDEILLSNIVLDIYNGLYQLTNPTIEVLSADNTLITPTILTTLDGLTTADQGKRVSIENLEVVSISSQNLAVTDGTNQITVRVGSTNNEVYTYIQSAIAGQKVNLTGIHVGWYNGAQFDLTRLDEIELVEVSDAEKVLMIKDELIDLYDNKSYTSGSTITLIETSTVHGGVITYQEATQLIDISTGLVGEVVTDTNVTLNITVTLNQEATAFTVAVTVKPESTEPIIVAQSDFGTTNNSNTNYGYFFIDIVDNGSLDPVAGTRSYSRAGGNYNNTGWDYIALGQKNVAARVGDLETSNTTNNRAVDSTDPNVYLATNFRLSNLNHMIIAMPTLEALTTIHVQTSTDGITWTNLTTHVQDTEISSMTDITIELAQQGDFYYRLVFENASPTTSNGWLGRIKTITYYS